MRLMWTSEGFQQGRWFLTMSHSSFINVFGEGKKLIPVRLYHSCFNRWGLLLNKFDKSWKCQSFWDKVKDGLIKRWCSWSVLGFGFNVIYYSTIKQCNLLLGENTLQPVLSRSISLSFYEEKTVCLSGRFSGSEMQSC